MRILRISYRFLSLIIIRRSDDLLCWLARDVWCMAIGCCDELEDFEGVGVFCTGGRHAEVVAQRDFDLGGVEAPAPVDVDAEGVGGLADGDAGGAPEVAV